MRYVVTILGILVVVAALAATKGAQIGQLIGFGKKMQENGPPPEVVSSARADEAAWEGNIAAVGSVASDKGVAVSNDAPGIVTRIAFESGAVVKQGQVLVELDTSVERAQLASAISRRELAITTRDRTKMLAEKGAISPAQLDNDDSQMKTSKTDVEAIQAQIAKKTIRAPFSGRLGIRNVNLGQYLNPGTAVTVLETIDAVHVDFTVPQQRLAELTTGMPVRITLEGGGADGRGAQSAERPESSLGGVGGRSPLTVIDGKIGAIDPAIDSATRTIKVRADVANVAERLRPGMFVNVGVVLPQTNALVTAPLTSIIRSPYGDSVFVIEPKPADAPGLRTTQDGKEIKVARQQFVKLGTARGDFVSITDGVKKGDELVATGAFKLRNGSPVVVDNSKPLSPSASPKPENR
jgi:membrane fusion protein (multidrug efflux system)